MSLWPFSKRTDVSKKTDGDHDSLTPQLPTSTSGQQLQRTTKPSTFKSDPTEGEYSLKILHDPEPAVVDIVFVHGLTGNRENTWTRNAGQGNACFWPRDLLPDADTGVANARIATWGYDAEVVNKRPLGVVSTNTIEQHAADLCTDLANIRGGEKSSRPLIFVVHSLGGLVVKTALLHANERRTQSAAHISAIADSTAGVVFMGTPHRGSDKAHWGGILASMLGYVKQDNAELVNRLNKEEPRLAVLQERFANFLATRKENNRPISITCFFEELPVPVLGTIVPAASAQMDSYPAIGIHANHMDMTKFGGHASAGYAKTVHELRRLVEKAQSPEQAGGNPSAAEPQSAPMRGGGGGDGTNIYGAISTHNFIAGTHNAAGGTTNFNFN